MGLDWIHEASPHWDANKEAIIKGAPAGAFGQMPYRSGDSLPDDWWRVEADGRPVGYGWMDCTWGDAEMLLAVDPGHQSVGVGTFILDHLEREAASRGLNYLYNVVASTHPDRQRVAGWLMKRGFQSSHDDERLMRRVRPHDRPAAMEP